MRRKGLKVMQNRSDLRTCSVGQCGERYCCSATEEMYQAKDCPKRTSLAQKPLTAQNVVVWINGLRLGSNPVADDVA